MMQEDESGGYYGSPGERQELRAGGSSSDKWSDFSYILKYSQQNFLMD